MHRLIIFPLCFVLSFNTISNPQDAEDKDSLPLSKDTPVDIAIVHDSSTDTGKDTTTGLLVSHDSGTLSIHARDTLYDTVGDPGTIQETDTAPLKETFQTGEKSTIDKPSFDTLGLPQKKLQEFGKSIAHFFRSSIRYFKHIIILVVFGCIILVTILFYRKKVDSKRFMTSTRLSIMDREVQLACKYMESHFDDPELSVERICEALVTGPAFLEALFDRELGMSVSEFLNQVRINRAKRVLIRQPNVTNDDLVSQIVFSDYELFQQKFKEISGVTIEEYQTSL